MEKYEARLANTNWVTRVRAGDVIDIGPIKITVRKAEDGKLRLVLTVPANITITKVDKSGKTL